MSVCTMHLNAEKQRPRLIRSHMLVTCQCSSQGLRTRTRRPMWNTSSTSICDLWPLRTRPLWRATQDGLIICKFQMITTTVVCIKIYQLHRMQCIYLTKTSIMHYVPRCMIRRECIWSKALQIWIKYFQTVLSGIRRSCRLKCCNSNMNFTHPNILKYIFKLPPLS